MYTSVLFDFDGTLADSAQCSVIATQNAFAGMALPAPAASEIIDNMGIPIEKSFRDMGAHDFSESQFERLLVLFREIYKKGGDNHITAFSGAVDLLNALKAQGKNIAIITSKKTDVAARNARKLGFSLYVDLIVGSDKVTQYKPHPEGIFMAMDYFGIDNNMRGEVIIVGDAVTDIEMGKNAGISTCAVTWGAHRKEKLQLSAPDYIADSFSALFELLHKK